jgi:signal transduction histidine kinase
MRARMAPAGRARAAAVAGALLLAAQAASTVFLGPSRTGLVASNLIQLAAGIAAALAATSAASRARAFARRHWTLIGAALWLWAAAQAVYSYHEIWLGSSVPQPSAAHFLFRLYGAPLVMALLLRTEETPAVDWQRVLDFAQVGIVFLFFYFDLYFVPGGDWRGLAELNLLGFLDLSDLENWLLVAGFLLRAWLAREEAPRGLAGRWLPFLLAYALTSSFYNYAYTFWPASTGSWHDLPWVATFVLGLQLAARWEPAALAAGARPGPFVSDWMPAVIPLITLGLALQVARRDLVVAFAAVFGSVACFGARLMVTQARQRRALADLGASERRYSELARGLEAKNDELERFTFTVSHDLRSPLITITGFLGFVERAVESGDAAAARADLARIRAAATRMERLLRDLLELSRVGRVSTPAQEVPVEALARDAVAAVQGELTARGVQVRVEPGLPTVYGDPVRLREVLQNLLENAVRYVAGQPLPLVTIGSAGDDPRGLRLLFVRDNGVGIDPRHHQRIFGLFEKLEPGSEGSGVGLAIVERVVKLHGGRVWVESAAGQGATFWFTLPGTPPPGASA